MRVLLAAIMLAGCTTSTVPRGPLFAVDRLETELKRGVSAKADVERVLGRPAGAGGASFQTDSHPRARSYEVWYYLDYRTRKVWSRDVLIIDVVPDMLLVFFDRGVFDGFMWFSHAGSEPAR